MNAAACAVCGARESAPVLNAREPNGLALEPFALVSCGACGHLFVSPRPEGAELARYYFREYYKKPGPALEAPVGLLARLFESAKTARLTRRLKPGRVLDVGCGDGGFLAAMRRRGWEGWGVETSKDGFALAAARQGLKVFDKPLPECGLPAARFDAVTLWHSLEHMEAPAAVLLEARRLLKPGGTLFLAIPSGSSWELALFKSRWFHLDLPRHLHFFTRPGAARLLKDCGFEVVEESGLCLDYNAYGFLQSVLNAVSCETNFLYRRLKGFKPAAPRRALPLLWDSLVLLFLGPLALLAALPYCLLAALFGRAGCVEVYARPR